MSAITRFFNPSSVAVIGATPREGKVGRVILENFTKRYRGRVYPVNPGYDEILGLKCYRSIRDLPEAPDLAVIAIPAPGVPEVLRELGEKGCKAAIIISGGFRETGTPEGERLENEVKEIALKYGIRIIGPNCIGIYDSWSGVDTFFLPEEKMKRPPKGYVAFISQSGAFASALMDWMAYNNIGVSRAVSYGNKVDVDDVDILEYLASDEKTRVILIYLEGLKDGRGRAFLEAARKVSTVKPVLIFKAGKTGRGSLAAASHTAALAGDYSVYKSAFKQAGIVEVESFDEMMDAVRILLDQPLMNGNRVYIITDAGGVGVMLTDALTSQGFELPRTPPDLREELRRVLPPHCIVENPIDLTGDTDDERYMKVLEKVLPRGDVDAVVVVALPQVPGIKGSLVEYLIEAKKKYGKPIIAVSIGGEEAVKIARRLQENGITVFESPERAAKALKVLYTYSRIKMKTTRDRG
ncbi:CoA-binding domain protein [Desulfurococcus mucosus DSM 2162]|uniref:CoA-binding domain protein n=1 Tax=Desulfurococcus mucosus (strain ATCC 35584 / DSM 2162 / JCM 9187 / O7/1) TaxID=765177 RepID=E8R717_DESM0|nr:CoA-binding protein [Desulfurococcus mucosus]ADV64450.1 CoA-binding domain protein [Desulfurococcus mucosus DSM 2162]